MVSVSTQGLRLWVFVKATVWIFWRNEQQVSQFEACGECVCKNEFLNLKTALLKLFSQTKKEEGRNLWEL
jgi:hypothetical protein